MQRRPDLELAAGHDPARGMQVPLARASAVAGAVCHLAAVETARCVADPESGLAGRLWSIDLRDRSSRLHRLVPRPGCSVCGRASPPPPAPIVLRNRPSFVAGGGFRATAPEDTLSRYGHLLSPIVGLAGSLQEGPPSPGAGRSRLADDIFGGRSNSLRDLQRRFRYSSEGKGVTDAQARASALGEVIERYSDRLHGTEVRLPGTYNDLASDAVDPRSVALFSDRQHEMRAAWNAGGTFRDRIPPRFDPDALIDWTPVWSLTHKKHRLLPTEMLYPKFNNRRHVLR